MRNTKTGKRDWWTPKPNSENAKSQCNKDLIQGRWGDSVITVASDGKTLTGKWDEGLPGRNYYGQCVGENKV